MSDFVWTSRVAYNKQVVHELDIGHLTIELYRRSDDQPWEYAWWYDGASAFLPASLTLEQAQHEAVLEFKTAMEKEKRQIEAILSKLETYR